jgi:hypothetical protein
MTLNPLQFSPSGPLAGSHHQLSQPDYSTPEAVRTDPLRPSRKKPPRYPRNPNPAGPPASRF